ncbi:MAG: hypothetical protein CVT94_00960 [Bacteroidetes bacterium HGW-Bacteroidetes-11]|jgi:hypothetical protein|nr:MAG: hypothetical protein CVT94_00960 [Bacteroidetes bacterium HGW-Bacteroidetes-11]
MKRYFKFGFLLLLLSCTQINNKSISMTEDSQDLFNVFDLNNHLKPDFDKTRFDTLHGWDFGWAILEPINIAKSRDDDKDLSKRFSPGQKALYFFWYLDEEVTNGGFIQYYWNGYRDYIPTIKNGLKLIGDSSVIGLIDKADKEYLANKDKFVLQRKMDDWEPLYNDLKKFDEYDQIYYKIHDQTMELIEKYIRLHPNDFVNLK